MSKLKWQCRRGMKELDVLLESYLERHYPHASPEQQHAFAHLLTCTDEDLYQWIMQKQTPEQVDAAQFNLLECLRCWSSSN